MLTFLSAGTLLQKFLYMFLHSYHCCISIISFVPANICWSSGRLEGMSWRLLEYVLETNKNLLGIYVSNKSKCVLSNLYFTNLHLTNLRRIQNALLGPNNFDKRLILKQNQYFYFRNWRTQLAHLCRILQQGK